MANSNRAYLQGLLAGTVAVAEVTGKIKIADMNDQTWRIVNAIHERLLAMAAAEAERLNERRPFDGSAQSKGGHARAAALSPERRSELASEAAKARWATNSAEK